MKIEADLLEELTRQARLIDPLECCGLLWTRGEGWIREYTPYPGPHFRERFEMLDEWLLKEHYKGRRDGLVCIGYYHSHSHSPALPSTRDLAGHPTGSFCLIVTPGGVSRAFRLEQFGFQEQIIEVVRS